MNDRIVLTLPAGKRLKGVASLVIGGIGSRLELPYERTDDLQLAVLSALEASDGQEVTLDVLVDDASLSVAVGPLAAASASDPALGRVLDRLVDSVEPSRRDDGTVWLMLRLRRA